MTYNYSSTAGEYSLTGAVTSSATTLNLNSVTGLPAVPFKVVIDPGDPTEEIVKVTNVAGLTLTVVRGWDSSAAVAHAGLAKVRHMLTAEDLRLSRQHEAATTGVHGTTGALVDVSSAQALTNKDLSSATNAFPATLATDTEVSTAVSNHAALTATHGATGAVVGTTNTQTLSNKTLNSPAITGTVSGSVAFGADVTVTGGVTAASATLSGALAAATATVGGVAVPKVKVVSFTATTDSGGYITTTHGLGFTPTAVICFNSAPASGFGLFWGAGAFTSTTFQTRWTSAQGTWPLASTSVSFTAVCFG